MKGRKRGSGASAAQRIALFSLMAENAHVCSYTKRYLREEEGDGENSRRARKACPILGPEIESLISLVLLAAALC